MVPVDRQPTETNEDGLDEKVMVGDKARLWALCADTKRQQRKNFMVILLPLPFTVAVAGESPKVQAEAGELMRCYVHEQLDRSSSTLEYIIVGLVSF